MPWSHRGEDAAMMRVEMRSGSGAAMIGRAGEEVDGGGAATRLEGSQGKSVEKSARSLFSGRLVGPRTGVGTLEGEPLRKDWDKEAPRLPRDEEGK
ncbi:MAG: Required for respiratory growth protein 9 mitochondrial, partial [Chaenotheca gracillima]